MGSFDEFARRARKKAQYAAKKKAERDAANKAASEKIAATQPVVKNTGFRSNLSLAQKWSLDNPEMAKYDNDGNPVTAEHWGW